MVSKSFETYSFLTTELSFEAVVVFVWGIVSGAGVVRTDGTFDGGITVLGSNRVGEISRAYSSMIRYQ